MTFAGSNPNDNDLIDNSDLRKYKRTARKYCKRHNIIYEIACRLLEINHASRH